jgi:hypothetical protein
MRTEPVLALTGRRGVPRRFLAQGFQFAHQAVGPAIDDVLAGS